MTLHKLRKIIVEVNRTHRRLGPLIAMNILAAKAKKTILNVAPAGTGKSISCVTVGNLLKERSKSYTSLTLAGMNRLRDEFSNYDGHVIIDDLGADRSLWSRVSTITVLANLVYSHFVHKVTNEYELNLEAFNGSVSLNIQPVLMNSIIQSDEWVAVVRDKVIRYYHLIRPIKPSRTLPKVEVDWGVQLSEVTMSGYRGKLWYQLVAIGLTQWSYARVEEHIPDLLKAAAALDGRTRVAVQDYKILIKLLQPLQLERYIVETYGFEQGRTFNNNLYCILVELASFNEPTIRTICEDYKVSPTTAGRLIASVPEWCWIKSEGVNKLMPTERTKEIMDICGANQKW